MELVLVQECQPVDPILQGEMKPNLSYKDALFGCTQSTCSVIICMIDSSNSLHLHTTVIIIIFAMFWSKKPPSGSAVLQQGRDHIAYGLQTDA